MPPTTWCLLIHQIPPRPHYFRAKVLRAMQKSGALALKNSVYILPSTPHAEFEFAALQKKIISEGGEAFVARCEFISGMTSQDVEDLFRADRTNSYELFTQETQQYVADVKPHLLDEESGTAAARFQRLKKRLADIIRTDFFNSTSRAAAEQILRRFEAQILASSPHDAPQLELSNGNMRGRVWVTRRGIHSDRMASAWLIRRFIDPDAQFKFVEKKGYVPLPAEIRFDMFEAEFTHEGNLCTFEVLLKRSRIGISGLKLIAEMIHDIDFKDLLYNHPQTEGVESVLQGIALHPDDLVRLQRSEFIFDDLLSFFSKQSD